MRLALTVVVVLIAALAVAAGAADGERRKMIAPEDFAILPWGWTEGDAKQLEWIKDCGFNLAGFVAPESLNEVEKAGLKAIVSYGETHADDAAAGLSQEEIDKRVKALTDRTKKSPAVYGYYLRDEPSAVVFEGLGRWAASVKKHAPDKMAYINLFPNYASPGQLGAATYEEHLDKYVATVRPRFISYDHYALMDDGSLRGGYFQNLEAVRKAAMSHNLPFWNIVLSNAHFHYAEPTPGGLSFQMFTTLAYGARGISYFTYFAPKVGNYRLAPVDQFGNKTATWDMLRNVNNQMIGLLPVYLTLKSVNVFHHPNVPEGCKGIDSSRFVAAVDGTDLLVGEFEDPSGRPYALIVNKSLHDSTAFGVRFKQAGDLFRVSAYSGSTDRWAGEDAWLAPGQGMLLCVRKDK